MSHPIRHSLPTELRLQLFCLQCFLLLEATNNIFKFYVVVESKLTMMYFEVESELESVMGVVLRMRNSSKIIVER